MTQTTSMRPLSGELSAYILRGESSRNDGVDHQDPAFQESYLGEVLEPPGPAACPFLDPDAFAIDDNTQSSFSGYDLGAARRRR